MLLKSSIEAERAIEVEETDVCKAGQNKKVLQKGEVEGARKLFTGVGEAHGSLGGEKHK